MFREGLPASVLVFGFSFSVLVVATLLMEPNTLALDAHGHRHRSHLVSSQAG